jgi:predicted nuclease with RNAse H fold
MARPARVESRRKQLVVVGVDLAGSPRRPTGVCVLCGLKAWTWGAFADEEILRLIDGARPDLVPIDVPLSLPYGRMAIHDRAGAYFRKCDRQVWRRHCI